MRISAHQDRLVVVTRNYLRCACDRGVYVYVAAPHKSAIRVRGRISTQREGWLQMVWRSSPTVDITVEVPVPTTHGDWRWVPTRSLNPAGQEHVLCDQDVTRIMLAYGVAVAQTLINGGPPRFRLVAHGTHSGRPVAQYQWRWEPMLGRYAPEAEPWVVYDATSALIAEGVPAVSVPHPPRP